MKSTDIPITPDLIAIGYSGGSITEYKAGITNGMIEDQVNSAIITHRPSFNINEDASVTVADTKGRCVRYWGETSSTYFVNNDTLYKNSYGNVLSTAITSGNTRCYFGELGDLLLLYNPSGGQLFTINSSDVVAEVTDVDFPPKQTPALDMAGGMVILDGFVFVMTKDGVIYHSNNQDAIAWTATDFVTAERENDGGVYIAKHSDHVVAMGVHTIEFFYNAGNPVGSVLNRRTDLQYNVGCLSEGTVWEDGDRIFFIGTDLHGSVALYKLENFNLQKIGNSTINGFLNHALLRNGLVSTASGFSGKGHSFYVVTIYSGDTDLSPVQTIAYDIDSQAWHIWDVLGTGTLPIVAWGKRTSEELLVGVGILSNGDLISVSESTSSTDTVGESIYVASDYVVSDYVVAVGAQGTNINLTIRTGPVDYDTPEWKFCSMIRPLMDATNSSQTMTISWTSTVDNVFTTSKTIDTSSYSNRLHRCGRFRRRNYQIDYSGDETIHIKALQNKIKIGTD